MEVLALAGIGGLVLYSSSAQATTLPSESMEVVAAHQAADPLDYRGLEGKSFYVTPHGPQSLDASTYQYGKRIDGGYGPTPYYDFPTTAQAGKLASYGDASVFLPATPSSVRTQLPSRDQSGARAALTKDATLEFSEAAERHANTGEGRTSFWLQEV